MLPDLVLFGLGPEIPGQVESERLRKLESRARAGRGEDRSRAWRELVAQGAEGRAVLTRVMVALDKELKGRAQQLFASASFQGAAQGLVQRLEESRKLALAYIRNPGLFRKGYGIKGMQDRVEVVRALWKRPWEYLGEKVESLGPLLAEAKEVAPCGTSLGLESLHAVALEERIREAAGLPGAAISEGQLRWNRAVMAWNAGDCPTSADEEEHLAVRLTNDYRLMMGLKALELDERILRAARAHSQEMEDLGYFSHTSPVAAHADFATRLRIQGFSGPINENIATARDARRAFHGWFLSAGHHRNMLHVGATAIAVGRSRGRGGIHKWTMNLGGGDSLRGRKLTDPALLYLQKRRQFHDGSAEGHLKLSRWCKTQGLIKEMSRECRAALRLDPRASEAREMLAERFKLRRQKR